MSSFPDQNKLKTYSTLLTSSLAEIRQLQNASNLPKILEKENSSAIQNALDKQAEEIEYLRQENSILESRLQNLPAQENSTELSQIFISKSSTFSQRFNQLIDKFNEIEDEKLTLLESQFYNVIGKKISINDSEDSSKLNEEIAELKDNNSKLLKFTDELKENNDQLVQTNKELENKIQDQKQSYEEMIIQLQNQLQDRNKQIQMLETEKVNDNTQSQTVSKLQNEMIEKDQTIFKLQNEMNEKDQTIFKLQNEINETITQLQTDKETEIQKLKSDYETKLQTQNLQMQNEFNSINKNKDLEISSLKNQISILSSKQNQEGIENLTKHIESLLETNSKLESDIENAQKLIYDYKIENTQIKESKSLLNNTILDLNSRIEDLECQIAQYREAQSNDHGEDIVLLRKTLEETREKDSKEIQSWMTQVRDGLNLNTKLKGQLDAVKKEKMLLQQQNQNVQQNFERIQFENSEKDRNIIHYKELLNEKDLFNKQLNSSYTELNESYQELLGQNSQLRGEFERFRNHFTQLLDYQTDPEIMCQKLTEIFESLAMYKKQEVEFQDLKLNMKLLQKQYNDRTLELNELSQQFKSMLERRNMSQNGNDSTLIKKYESDFADLYTQHSNLIKEHETLNSQVRRYESIQNEYETKIHELASLNQELSEKTENLDVYQFITTHLIDLLSILSSSLISNSILTNSPKHDERLKLVDGLLVLLKTKEHLTFDNLEILWSQFSSLIQDVITNDPSELLQNHISQFESVLQSKMTTMYEKIQSMNSKMMEIDEKYKTVFPDDSFKRIYNETLDTYQLRKLFAESKPQQPRLSLYERSLKRNQMATTPDAKSKNKIHAFNVSKTANAKTPNNKSSFVTYVNPLARPYPSMKIDTPFE